MVKDASTVVLHAFSVDNVVRLTGLSKGQLRYWDKKEFFPPQYASDDRRDAYSRIYSFNDVVGLRALSILRKKHNISFQRLRDTARKLANYDKSVWSSVRLYVANKTVYFGSPDSDTAHDANGQSAPVIFLETIIGEVAAEARKLRERSPAQIGQISQDRLVARNSPTIAGTRIPTATIRRFHEAGYTTTQIIRQYPTLTKADVKAALQHEGLAQSA